jgi:hypothetical protein
MREPTLHKIAIVVVAFALGSAVIVTDAVAADGHAGGGGGDGAMAGGRFSNGFGRGGFEHGHYGRDRGRAVPFGYYPYGYYDDYGDNGCQSLDGYGCE